MRQNSTPISVISRRFKFSASSKKREPIDITSSVFPVVNTIPCAERSCVCLPGTPTRATAAQPLLSHLLQWRAGIKLSLFAALLELVEHLQLALSTQEWEDAERCEPAARDGTHRGEVARGAQSLRRTRHGVSSRLCSLSDSLLKRCYIFIGSARAHHRGQATTASATSYTRSLHEL